MPYKYAVGDLVKFTREDSNLHRGTIGEVMAQFTLYGNGPNGATSWPVYAVMFPNSPVEAWISRQHGYPDYDCIAEEFLGPVCPTYERIHHKARTHELFF